MEKSANRTSITLGKQFLQDKNDKSSVHRWNHFGRKMRMKWVVSLYVIYSSRYTTAEQLKTK